MHARIATNVGAQMTKYNGTEAITEKSIRITIETKLTYIPDIDLTQLLEVPSATIIRLPVGNSSKLNLLAKLSVMTFGIAAESNEP